MKNMLLFFIIILVLDGMSGETVSVKKGDSVTLHTGLTENNNVIDWRFGDGSLIGRVNRPANKIEIHDDYLDGKFKDRLKLQVQNGDLTIKNIKMTDSGDYKVTINNKNTIFSVSVLNADAVTVIEVTVMEGDSVTLQADPTDIQTYVVTQWRFKHQMLNDQTGSLAIKNIGTNQSGLYEADISSTRGSYSVHYTQSFNVTVSDHVESLSLMVGDSVTLHTGLTEIQTDYKIQWMLEDEFIADLNGSDNKERNNTYVDSQTRDLIISNISKSGDYKVEIKTRRMILHRKFRITIIVVTDGKKSLSVKEGDSATLPTVIEIQNNDLIHWMIEDTVIAEILKAAKRFYISAGLDISFRRRLQLNNQTGSLIITNTTTTDSGLYELRINSSRCTINRRINVTVTGSDLNSGSGLSPGAVAGIVVVVLLVF